MSTFPTTGNFLNFLVIPPLTRAHKLFGLPHFFRLIFPLLLNDIAKVPLDFFARSEKTFPDKFSTKFSKEPNFLSFRHKNFSEKIDNALSLAKFFQRASSNIFQRYHSHANTLCSNVYCQKNCGAFDISRKS